MPGVDGFTLLPRLRRAKINVPVLYLTAKDTIEDRVKGLDLALMTTSSSPLNGTNCSPAAGHRSPRPRPA